MWWALNSWRRGVGVQCCLSMAAAVCFAAPFLVVDLCSVAWWLLICDALQSNLAVSRKVYCVVWCESLIFNLTPQLHHNHLPSSNQRAGRYIQGSIYFQGCHHCILKSFWDLFISRFGHCILSVFSCTNMLRPTIPYVAVIPFFLRVFNWSSIVFSTYVYPSCTRCAINLIIYVILSYIL